MKLVWPALLGVFRTAYLAYSVWCLLFPLALVALLVWGLGGVGSAHAVWHQAAQFLLALWSLVAVYAVVCAGMRRQKGDPNPWQSGFMAWFGTLKLFKNTGGGDGVKLWWPSAYLVENPRSYRISGPDTRQILAVLQPGDILLRGYAGYVDGEFIRRSARTSKSGFQAGWFTHVALYAGELTAADYSHVPSAFHNDTAYFAPGPQMVIHSMAKGVHTEDVLTFLRCDYLAVLRLPPQLCIPAGGDLNAAAVSARHKTRHASPSNRMSDDLVYALQHGRPVTRAQVAEAAKQSALEKIGEAYDFDCSDTTQFHRFSCAELLYYCLRGVQGALGLTATPHALYPLAPWFPRVHMLERTTITPDDYYNLWRERQLECVWEDAFSKALHKQQEGAS